MKEDHSFFSKFFDDERLRACCECDNSEERLQPLGSATGGAQLWICDSCLAARTSRNVERALRNREARQQSEELDYWEESHDE
jgi:acyl-coenzyme A thioesterase PaaI-like protein